MKKFAELREALDTDIRSHSMRQLASIMNNPQHPLHSAAKAEHDRRMMARNLRPGLARESTLDEMGPSRSMSPMKNRFGPAVDSKKFDVYKKHMKTHNLDEPTVRMAHDNPDHGESKRMMKNPKYSKGLELYKASMKEATYSDTGWQKPSVKKDKFGNVIKTKNIAKSLAKAAAKQSAGVQNETKGAPKGYHFTRDGKLKKGDAGADGDGGAMLRSDPLDKQRSKIPPIPEKFANPAQQAAVMAKLKKSGKYDGKEATIPDKDKLSKIRGMMKRANEAVGLDELSQKTLTSYSTKASDARAHRKLPINKVDNRYAGVAKASKKLDKLNANEALERDGPKQPDIFGPKGSFGKAASLNPHVQKYMSKRAASNQARNKAMDPGAAKKGYGIGVTDVAKADKKAKEKGTSILKRMASSDKNYKAGRVM